MTSDTHTLIGRQREQAELDSVLATVQEGKGGLVLLAGEAGVGKTRLANACLARSGLRVLVGGASEIATPLYGPIVAVLRAYMRAAIEGFRDCGPLSRYLALLLPELGPALDTGDGPTLCEAIRCAFETIARQQPTAVFLDDLQWADNATLELLPVLASALAQEQLLIVGAYRSDEIPRGHAVRWLRHELRRAGQLHEVVVEPLGREETIALATRLFGQTPSLSLATLLYDRSQGVPLFIEELATALTTSGRLMQMPSGLGLVPGEDVPVPETVRDAVLLRLDKLSHRARRLLEIAAVAGLHFDLEMVVELAGDETGLEELIEHSLISEVSAGRAAFRHALMHEAIYRDIIWTRRRTLHRQLALRLEAAGAPPAVAAEHWLAGRELERARRALLSAAQQSCDLHAYRDAAAAAYRALELWPEGEAEIQRLDVLDQLGRCAELCGMLAEAAHAWREVADGRRRAGDMRRFAEVQRCLATVYELQGVWAQALEARQAAAEAFAVCDLPGEAAAERLAHAEHLQSAGSFNAALELVNRAIQEAEQSGRHDLKACALGLKGELLANLGRIQAGREVAQTGLALALEYNLSGPAAEAYFRLANILDQASDYPGARETYQTAINYCEAQGVATLEQMCLACLAVVLRQTGEWKRASSLCCEVMASPEASPPIKAIATGVLGMIHAHWGQARRARKLLLESVTQARWAENVLLEMLDVWGLAIVDELEGAYDAAAEHCQFLLARWEQTEDRHYAIPELRWAATFFAGRKAGVETRACANALSRIAAATGNPEAIAALAHALGESALLDGDAAQASRQFSRSIELMRELEVPLERAETHLRAGVALAAAGDRRAAVAQLVNAYRTARTLDAQPLAVRAARELDALGEPVVQRLGRRAERQLTRAGLTQRQLEIVRLIAFGKTNQEIARELVLSPRTVDMHVSNILNKLDCRSRAEAVRKAGELGLLG